MAIGYRLPVGRVVYIGGANTCVVVETSAWVVGDVVVGTKVCRAVGTPVARAALISIAVKGARVARRIIDAILLRDAGGIMVCDTLVEIAVISGRRPVRTGLLNIAETASVGRAECGVKRSIGHAASLLPLAVAVHPAFVARGLGSRSSLSGDAGIGGAGHLIVSAAIALAAVSHIRTDICVVI